jgi:transposase
MRPAIFVRSLTADERSALEAGLRSADAFILRRCQMLLASARGQTPPHIAQHLGCHDQTVRNMIRVFNTTGIACLRRRSSRPHSIQAAFDPAQAEALRALLHQRPRAFGKPTSLWPLALAAEVCCEQGLTAHQVSGETIRATLARLGVCWRRAKQWITSPDPAYAREKRRVTG